jgi:hypothetical protein
VSKSIRLAAKIDFASPTQINFGTKLILKIDFRMQKNQICPGQFLDL